VLSRQYGYTLDEIARELGVSRGMVKKYLAKALAHFRLHAPATEARE
jgi:DNA-directed RNA polymerase specialized sigma24 family protein